jgi:hypothetical protein
MHTYENYHVDTTIIRIDEPNTIPINHCRSAVNRISSAAHFRLFFHKLERPKGTLFRLHNP